MAIAVLDVVPFIVQNVASEKLDYPFVTPTSLCCLRTAV
jgi:hypothetical protein